MKNIPLFVISAPSGVGKNTIINQLIRELPSLVHSISSTTRKPRAYEEDAVHYYFLKHKEFQQKISHQLFLEYKQVLNDYYGTTLAEIDRITKQGKYPILDIDVQGLLALKTSNKNIISIFVLPPSIEELKRRLIGRGTESNKEIQLRIETAQKELLYKEHYDYCFINDKLTETTKDIASIIKQKIEQIQ